MLLHCACMHIDAGVQRTHAQCRCIAHACAASRRRYATSPHARRVVDYIQANLEGDIRLEELANIACLSRFHFVRAFKAATGTSPYRYVADLRIERAKTLLRLGQLSLVEIAVELNFSSQATFTRAFRKATGHTPGQYLGRHEIL